MNLSDLKEKCIIVCVSAGIFLPFRLLVGQYLTEHWLGNIGFATAVSLLILFLTKKNKLGRFGEILENQTRKTLWGKSSKLILLLLLGFMLYFGSAIILINQGNTAYRDDKEALFKNMFDGENRPLQLNGPSTAENEFVAFSKIRYLEYVFSLSYAILNDMTGDLLVSMHLILFIEQIEMIGLFWLYRKVFRPINAV